MKECCDTFAKAVHGMTDQESLGAVKYPKRPYPPNVKFVIYDAVDQLPEISHCPWCGEEL